jgi:glutamate-1-semialdehyde 2,1-aminomutase
MRMYPDPNSSSQKMYDRALASLPGGNTRTTVFMKPYPIYAARGEGCRVWDLDGNVYIDCINNFTSQIHGHAHPALIRAATAQLALGSAFGLPTASEVDLAELLVSRLPSVEQVRFANSGTEAVMMALKAARAHTGRPKIAKCEGAYHGSYDYAEVSLDPTRRPGAATRRSRSPMRRVRLITCWPMSSPFPSTTPKPPSA